MQLYCGPSPHISYIGFPKISQDLLRFPIGFPQYIRHSHIRHSWRHSYIYDIPMAFLAACIPTACYGTYTACMLIIYDMHAPIRHSYAKKNTWWLSVCLRTTCLRHAYDRHAYDMHIYGMPTTCLYIRHAYTTCMPIYDMPIRHAYIYDMLTTCLRHAYTRHAYDMLTTCLYGMPTTCLRHACLRHAYDMPTTSLYGMPMASLWHPYDMPTTCLRHAYDMPTTCLRHAYDMISKCTFQPLCIRKPN